MIMITHIGGPGKKKDKDTH